MPSPRIEEPRLIGDGRRPVQDNTLADAFTLLAPVAEQVGTNIVVNEYEGQAREATAVGLDLTRRAIANAEAPMPEEAERGISNYARDVANIRNAVAQGAVGENAAKVRINALTREYARRFPAFSGEFTSRNSALESEVTAAFEQDSVVAQNKRQAEERSRARNEIVDAGLNPDDPAQVQLWMDTKQETARNALITARNARTAAEKEQQELALARNFELRSHATILEATTRLLQEQKEVEATGGDLAGWFRARKEMFPQQYARLRADIIAGFSPSPLRDRMLKDLEDTYKLLENVSDPGQLKDIQQNLLEMNKAYYSRGYLDSLDPRTREVFSALGADFTRPLDDLANRLLQGNQALDALAGPGTGAAITGMLRDMLQLEPGQAISPLDIKRVQDEAARAADPNSPRTPEGAAVSRALLEGVGPRLPTQVSSELYRKVAGTNREMPLLWWTARNRLPLAAQVSGTPEFQRRVAKEVTAARIELSRFDKPRLQIIEHEDGTEGWRILDSSGRILLNDTPFYIPSGDGNTPPQAARMPLSDSVRDTINALQILGVEGIQTKDGQDLQDELIRANDSESSNQRRR